ncbi:hypothetical protein O181_056691 [Austropuccinia psidii MF-1]|uniref:Uncharacterized protein n=1 Tax=Austropuccinia psidii MF-1 TaxID=1389203 RepID=A0A9Q3E6U3_9BASI|nr:hypothetical protein [Austropuccinia psidii MF-1]
MSRFDHFKPKDDTHQLSSKDFRHHRSQFNSNQHPNLANRNAFGDDSDSDDDQGPNHQRGSSAQDFDVYKDFNNQGIRYVSLLNNSNDHQSNLNTQEENIVSDLNHPNSPLEKSTSSTSTPYPPQSQSKPALDFANRNSNNPNSKNSKLNAVKKDWRLGAVLTFIALALLGLAVFFLHPRQPFISYEIPISLNSSKNTDLIFSARNPTNFSFKAQLEMALDGRSSYLPLRLSHLDVILNDLGSTGNSVLVGKGNLGHSVTVKPSGLTHLNFNVHFEYATPAPSDALWQNWRKACGNIAESTTNGTISRPALQLHVTITFSVLGMIGQKADSAPLNGVSCPAELPAGAPSF